MLRINIRDFSVTPGGRWRKDGQFSGEEFREVYLEPLFSDPNDDSIIEVNLDGVEGYATSFLEEVFGGLARKYSTERCVKRLRFVSVEDSLLPDQIIRYIEDANPKP